MFDKKINMHTDIVVTLTDTGAKIINDRNRWLREHVKGSTAKIDYKAGDKFGAVLWEIMEMFGPYCYVGATLPFVEFEAIFKQNDPTMVERAREMKRLLCEEYDKWDKTEQEAVERGAGMRGPNGGLVGYSLEDLFNEVVWRLDIQNSKGVI